MFDMFRDEEELVYELGQRDGEEAFHGDQMEDIYDAGYSEAYALAVSEI